MLDLFGFRQKKSGASVRPANEGAFHLKCSFGSEHSRQFVLRGLVNFEGIAIRSVPIGPPENQHKSCRRITRDDSRIRPNPNSYLEMIRFGIYSVE